MRTIKQKIWDEHFDAEFPELMAQKIENQFDYQLSNPKLGNVEKKRQLVHGFVLACKSNWDVNKSNQQLSEITIDATSLWKVCVREKDIYKLANCLQNEIHANIADVYAKVDVSFENITIRLIDRSTITPPFVETWLHSKVKQGLPELTFDKLDSFYQNQPKWVKHKQNFFRFIHNLFETIKKATAKLLSYKIDKQSRKVILEYAL